MMKRGLLVVAVVLTCGSLALGGDMVGINFVGGESDGLDANSANGGTVTGDAGVVLQPNWNNMIGADSGGPSAPLIDNTGVTTATTVEWAAPNVWNLGNLPDDGGNNSLMRGYLDNFWNLGTLTVRNVPFERYEVYVYGDSDRAVGTIDGYLMNGSFNSQQDRTEGGFTGDFVLGTDYVKFANLSIDGNGTDFTITAAQVEGNGAAPVSGIQVVNADLDLPELTLTVDRDTGNMTLSNEEDVDTTFSGYAILSDDGVLLPDQWDPITGNGWSVTSSTVEDLSQDTTSDTTLAPGESIDLGNAWGEYYDEGDVQVQAVSANGVAAKGEVTYVGNNDEAFAFGDLNFDGVIDAADFEDVLRPGYGGDTTGLSIAEAYRLGDLNADMVIDETDALLLKQEIVAAGGAVAGLAIADVPEPSTLVLLGLGSLLCAVRRRVALGRCLMVLAVASLFLATSMASAASIGMNFVDGTVDNRGSGGGGTLAPGDVAGEPSVAQANWNNASPDGAANNGALTGLIDSAGATTTVDVTWASNNTWAAGLPPTTPDQALMGGWIDDSGPGPTGGNLVEVRNVPYPFFDLYVYTNSDVGNANGVRHARIELDDAQGGLIEAPQSGPFEDPLSAQEDYFYDVYVNGNDDTNVNPSYFFFEDVSLADFNITGDRMDDPDVRGAISGFQIVETSGIPNRLTLEVDRATGSTQIINNSGNQHDIDLYRMMSDAGSLDPAGWNSLEDQGINDDGTPNNGIGWETLGTASGVLSEIIIEGADGDDFLRFDADDSVSLGDAFGGGAEDLVFQYHFPGNAAAQFVTGLIEYVGEVPDVLLGDVNLDEVVNGLDVDPFVDVLLNGPYQAEADMNEDTVVNGLDVDPFVEAVVGGGLQAVPEPSTLVLLGLALVGLVGYRRARS